MHRSKPSRGGRQGNAATRVTRTSFANVSDVARTTSGTTFTTINLSPGNLGTRAGFECENYEWFRITSLRVHSVVDTVVPGSTVALGGAVLHGIAFNNSPLPLQNAPTTVAQMCQAPHFDQANAATKASFSVGRRELLSEPYKWFNTETTGTPPTGSNTVGTIIHFLQLTVGATSQNVGVRVWFTGTIEYHTPIDPNDSSRVRVPRSLTADPVVAKAMDRLRDAVDEATQK
jgi:hypothetical protein